jgi:hydroxymethylpyrimidine/phosphomethylpyrimidine kinase
MMDQPAIALTIAGTDPSGGAGIQADLKTFQEFTCYGMSVITSVVAQNTTGVQDIHHIPLDMIEKQLESVISDIPFQAFKTGMIANIDMMEIIKIKIDRLHVPYVMDPVMVATSGDALISEDARDFLRHHLLSQATVVTPNIPEAEFLTGETITTLEDLQMAAEQIVDKYGSGAALVKGGHLDGAAVDFLYDGTRMYRFSSDRIATKNTHGTGCTISAAITALLAKGLPLPLAVEQAKNYVTSAIRHSFSIGQGNGPTNHWAARSREVKQ